MKDIENKFFPIKNDEDLSFGVCKAFPTVVGSEECKLNPEIAFVLELDETLLFVAQGSKAVTITLDKGEARKLALRLMAM